MKSMIKNVMRGHISAVVLQLLDPNNSITTLEIKNELRRQWPEFSWLQKDVSNFMNELHLSGEVTYNDNGTFRTYSGETPKTTSKKKDTKTGKTIPKVKMTNISKSDAFDKIMANKGYFFTAEVVKKNGDHRVINCQALKDQDPKLGYIKVKEASLMRTDPDKAVRQINIQTIKALKIAGVAYKIK